LQIREEELNWPTTLFLDEIGEMSPELQVKLLRLIQEGEIEKIGSEAKMKVDVQSLQQPTATCR
jgi:Nif-specific regulatory protein